MGTAQGCQHDAEQPKDYQFSNQAPEGCVQEFDRTMRVRSILTLASVAMILMVAGVGNAFAAVWFSGTMASTDYGTHVTLDESSYGDVNVSKTYGDNVAWLNQFHNNVSFPDYAGVGGYCDPTTDALDIPSHEYSLSPGAYIVKPQEGYPKYYGGPFRIHATHGYRGDGGSRASPFNTNMKFTAV